MPTTTAREIISSLRLELEKWSPAFTDLLGPDDEDFLWIVFDPALELPRALKLTYCALSRVAVDWEGHFDPPGRCQEERRQAPEEGSR